MKIVHIKDKLEEIGVSLNDICMGDFDQIGEFTAKRNRSPTDPNYKKYGAFFRANYERGILVYFLIRQFNLTSFLEVGFGRGYTTFCASRAFYDAGVEGKITTIDCAFDENYIKALQNVFPKQWFNGITFARGNSQDVLPHVEGKFDLVYIDGDHSYAGTQSDWKLSKDKVGSFILFDDYLLPTRHDAGIQCRAAIDEIKWDIEGFNEPELIRLDRRMFLDDRGLSDEQIDYGQCLASRVGVGRDDW